ncbi:hypothetical protein GCM10010169_56470 [Micromonospora fulviviridis]|nr:hypothetical protein GCM10010169_56470 [Micromonospora fulviviridis]
MRGEPVEAGAGLFEEGVDARTHHVMEHLPMMPTGTPGRPANGLLVPQDPADEGRLASVG